MSNFASRVQWAISQARRGDVVESKNLALPRFQCSYT